MEQLVIWVVVGLYLGAALWRLDHDAGVFDIGGRVVRWYRRPGKTLKTATLGRVLYDGPPLLHVLYRHPEVPTKEKDDAVV